MGQLAEKLTNFVFDSRGHKKIPKKYLREVFRLIEKDFTLVPGNEEFEQYQYNNMPHGWFRKILLPEEVEPYLSLCAGWRSQWKRGTSEPISPTMLCLIDTAATAYCEIMRASGEERKQGVAAGELSAVMRQLFQKDLYRL